LVEVKDLSLLIEAVGIVCARGLRLKAVIVGDGPQRGALEQQSRAAGLEGVVEFRGEVRPAWGPLGEFDVYALTSISEGVPLSVLEAMSAGLPVVATAVGGIPEVIEDGVTGYLIARDDDRAATAGAIADRLEALLKDPQARERMGRAGAESVGRRFTTETAARETIHFYERIAAGRSDDRGA
jgi:glycosyltransferase involved in cell wall biosynthesis